LQTLSKPIIQLNHVSKLFYKQEQRTVKELLPALFTGKRSGSWFWAVRDVSIDINKGDTIGIIGKNGSGKSTLLKMIAAVTQPTEGSMTVEGHIAPLIELGAGFHPELTGRENVFLNGVILGMKHKEIERKFKAIVDFAEIWDFIDQPIKRYSSGMYLRLAFSVAIHTDPEILLVDEILAVGDVEFQKKCMKRIQEYLRSGGTLILVSHDMELVKRTCNRVIHLEKGLVVDQYDLPQSKER
jgi:ABC-type polysaccharide/polyol phosphate transport system ATPase subunit